MGQKKIYDKEYKVQAVKLGREVGFSKAAEELGIPTDTIYGWNKAAKAGRLRTRTANTSDCKNTCRGE